MGNFKVVLALGLLGFLVLFAVQNAEALEVKFLFWSFTLRRAVMLFVVFAVGVLSGFVLSTLARRESARHPH